MTPSGRQHAAVNKCVWRGHRDLVKGSHLEDPRRWAGGRARAWAWVPHAGRSAWGLQKPVVQAALGTHVRSHGGRSQSSVPRFEQHAFQKQLAVTPYAGLVQPQGQVGQGEVVVRGVCQLPHNGAL